ncbi:MAG: hypothetical protein VKJ06_06290 [Vampirovibrionales bacterium]|nr:hypothetical protein [Vampirovibrionales bacterium]
MVFGIIKKFAGGALKGLDRALGGGRKRKSKGIEGNSNPTQAQAIALPPEVLKMLAQLPQKQPPILNESYFGVNGGGLRLNG